MFTFSGSLNFEQHFLTAWPDPEGVFAGGGGAGPRGRPQRGPRDKVAQP